MVVSLDSPCDLPAGVPTVLAGLVSPARVLLRGKVPKHVLYCFGTGMSEPLRDEYEQREPGHCDRRR